MGQQKTSFQLPENRETSFSKVQKTDACRQKKDAGIFEQRCCCNKKMHKKNEQISACWRVGMNPRTKKKESAHQTKWSRSAFKKKKKKSPQKKRGKKGGQKKKKKKKK